MALPALLAVCLALRTVNLGALPIFFDEAGYTRAAQIVGTLPRPTLWLISLNYGAPPFFSWLAAPFTRLIPDPLLATRLASAVIGTVGLLAIWAAGRALWGSMAALLAAALYALCPFVLFYNRIALLDGLVATCGAGALFFTLELSRHARTRDALALGLCLAAGMLTKIFAVSMLLMPVLAVVAAWPAQRRAVRRKALPAALLGLLPLALLLLTPQGGGLLSATHTHAHAMAQPLTVIVRQLATWAQALWLYLTLPILALAVLGLWTMRHERAARLLAPWALLGGLPPALVPGAFLAPRYFLYSAVPILLLSVRGLLAVAAGLRARLRPVPLGLLALCGAALTATPAAATDFTMIGTPSQTPLVAFDRWQYLTGWPSGYALMQVVAYLHRQEAHGPITVISSLYNPPGDALIVLLGRDRAFTLTNVDFSAVRRHPLSAAPGQRAFVIACRPYGQRLHVDPHLLRLRLTVHNADGVGGVDVYEVIAR
jgi:4-amino-4-deoxy-L-arabinose transferase-like glycosyltransferase